MANPFVHVELQSNDLKKAKEFYSKLFGWKLKDEPMPGGTYTMIDVGGGTGGGMITNSAPGTPSHWMAYVGVDDINASTKHAKELGAKVVADVRDAGHTVLVRERHTVDTAERGGLSGIGGFASSTDTVHRIQVDASWGAGHGNLVNGGVQQREFLYNETTGKWADVERGTVVPQAVGPYHGHPVDGVYHPKH